MATRLKAQAQTAVPQSKNDCAEYIRRIGDLQREFERRRAEMNDAIAAITQDHQPTLEALSAREREILRLVAVGHTSSEIGVRLSISAQTVNSHIKNVYRKLQVRSRAQAVTLASTYGILY